MTRRRIDPSWARDTREAGGHSLRTFSELVRSKHYRKSEYKVTHATVARWETGVSYPHPANERAWRLALESVR